MIDTPSAILGLVVGVLLLIAGRRLFWLFVGFVGFATGLSLAPAILSGQPEWMPWLVAALFGLAGMFLAFVLQRLAVAVAGFLVGGFFAMDLLGLGGTHLGILALPVFIAGGVAAAMLALRVFEGALIFLSSLAGAGLIVNAFDLAYGTRSLALIGLTALGIAVQAGITARRRGRAGLAERRS